MVRFARMPGSRDRKSRLVAAPLESLEARTLLAVLPPAQYASGPISIPGGGGNDSTSTVAIDRYNPQHLAAAWVRTDPTPWRPAIRRSSRVPTRMTGDRAGPASLRPSAPDRPRRSTADDRSPYDVHPDREPQRCFRRQSSALRARPTVQCWQYLWRIDPDQVRLHRWISAVNFVDPTAADSRPSNIVRQYIQDPVFNPTLAVDDNQASFTDPTTHAVQQGLLDATAILMRATCGSAGARARRSPRDSAPTDQWNPNSIQVISSSNGGQSFTSPLVVNNNGRFGHQRDATPRIVVSQGGGGATGGQATIIWDDNGSGATAIAAIRSDRVESDPGWWDSRGLRRARAG